MVTVISLGGSIIAPEGVDSGFLAQFASLVYETLDADRDRRYIIVTGGGAPARVWQQAYKAAASACPRVGQVLDEEADWIGVSATRLNAQLLRAIFSEVCPDPVVTDPTSVRDFAGRVLVASGWKPGFSTDNDAILLAENFAASQVINLSNIEKVYTADPKTDKSAKPIDAISWPDFRKIVGDTWKPGANVPFDPVASRRAQLAGIKVICAAGKDLQNLRAILSGKPFVGTTIG